MKRLLVLIVIVFTVCARQSDYIPQEIFGLTLSKKLTDIEAADFINRLHWQEVTDSRTEIGFYKGSSGEAVIYATYYLSAEEAAEFEKQMTGKISAENTPFIMGKYMDIEGKQIYRTFGMGQTHYVFSHNNVLIWVSAGTAWAEDFLKEYLVLCRTI